MSPQRVLSVSIVGSLLFLAELAAPNSVVFAQDLSKTVLPITELKWMGPGIKVAFGTAFCLDAECRFIGTNYHVAVMAQPHKIKGEKVIQRYLATGPDDDGATVNESLSMRPMKYTLSRDLGIFELRAPLRHYHGIPFSLEQLEAGQQVDIYTYPKESINPFRKLMQFHGTFKGESVDGLLGFEYTSASGETIHPGASGGLIVDSKTQRVVGILNAVAANEERIALAVPVESLADFVSKVQPWVAQRLFPPARKGAVSPAAADLYPKFAPPPSRHIPEHRPDEPLEIKVLRAKAQNLADGMRNFIAVQSFEWGSGGNAPRAYAEYEIRVVDDSQRFRRLPDGKGEIDEAQDPGLLTYVTPSDQWSKLPAMVGTDFRLKVIQSPDATVDGRRIKVFRYYASVEDDVCPFRPTDNYIFFKIGKTVAVACYGEVWTDPDTNVIRISLHLDLSDKLKAYRGWERTDVVLTYDWLSRPNEPPRLIPLTIYTEASDKKHTYWCRGAFANYRIFSSRAEIVNVSKDRLQTPLP